MFHAASFASSAKHRHEMFDLSPDSIEGVAPYDRPLVVQFCANDKDHFLNAAQQVTDRCDAVDLNLGCPQGIAKRGHYGAFLMEEWNLVRNLSESLRGCTTSTSSDLASLSLSRARAQSRTCTRI